MNTENLSTLKIHKLTQAQYDRELEAGRIEENALYLTPDTVDQYQLNPIYLLPTDEVADCYFRLVGGEKEWITPVMMNGVRYRTSERHNGKPVYMFRVKESVELAVMGLTYDDLLGIEDIININGVIKTNDGGFYDLNNRTYNCNVYYNNNKLWVNYTGVENINDIDSVTITVKFTLN